MGRLLQRILLERRVRIPTLAGVVLISASIAATVAFAAALAIAPKHLTVLTSASAVPTTTCTLTPSIDSHVEQDDDSNFGSATALHVQSYETTVLVLTTNRNRRAFVKFDLSSCSIPANARVTNATLSVFLSSAPNQNRTWNIRRVTAAWTESGITWSNQPGTAATNTTTVTTGTTSNVTRQATVTSDVAAFVSGSQTNNGWRFSDSVEGSSTQRNGQFSSSEHATATQRPSLVITYYP